MKYNIEIHGVIGYWPNVRSAVKAVLDENEGKHVDILIDSPGGLLSVGLTISDLLCNHGDVTVYIHGLTASAATVIAMGAKRIVMSKYAMMLVHQVSNWVDEWGAMNATEIQEAIARLEKNRQENEKMDLMLASMYADRTGKSLAEMHSLMVKGQWMSAEECLAYGLVDEVTEEGKPPVIDKGVQDMFNSVEIPLPLSIDFGQTDTSHSLMRRLAALFGKKEDTNQNNNKMTKINSYTAINALLNVTDIEADDKGSATLSKGQLEAIDSRLALITDRDSEIDRLKKDNKEKDDTIAALKAAPAEEQKNIKEETADSSCDTINKQLDKIEF